MRDFTNNYDAVIIGGGHNGLVAAAYLARGGARVIVLEAASRVGGAAVSEEFHAGYRNSVFSYVVSLLDAGVIADMRLYAHGLEIIDRPAGSLSLTEDDYCWFARDMDVACENIARFSKADAAAYRSFCAELDAVVPIVRYLVRRSPLDLDFRLLRRFRDWLGLGYGFLRLGASERRVLQELLTASVGDYLARRFRSDIVQGHFGFEGIIGHFASIYEPGSAYVLLHHAFGEINGKIGAWGYAKGGMGSVTDAMRKQCESLGVDIITDAPVQEVLIENNCAIGVRLQNGDTVLGKRIVSNVGPRVLFLRLIDKSHLDSGFYDRMRTWRCASGSFRMNLALSDMPEFKGMRHLRAPQELLNGTINIAPSAAYLENAYASALRQGYAEEPVISACMPSLVDNSLTDKPNHHVMSLFCQHFNPNHDWHKDKHKTAEHIIAHLQKYMPNLRDILVGTQINSPADIEQKLNMSGGDIFHGRLQPDQIYNFRPAKGFSQYAMPIRHLYLCGAGAHPGGGVTGLPGKNAAKIILRTL